MDLPLAFVIEDDFNVAEIFAMALGEAGYSVKIIRDGMEALEELKMAVPALVVLDLRLPKVHGIQVLMAIRADTRLKGTRVIVTSVDATQTRFLREEADLILVKPVGFHQLRELADRLKPIPE